MNKNKYEDIINLPHHISLKHPQMPISARAAQFAPFKALTGYEDNIKETERLTDKKIELTEEEKDNLNNKLQIINQNIKSYPEITITYFVSDKKKQGGQYITKSCIVKKIDMIEQYLILTNKTKIKVNDIINITGGIFKSLEE